MRWIEASDKYMRLKSASRIIAHRIGGTAYFVGSALTSEVRPRDTDVRIVLIDEDFEKRYGLSPKEWQWQASACEMSDERWHWYEEKRKLEATIADACGERTIDLGIIPEMLWKRVYENAPHERWDSWAPSKEAIESVKAAGENNEISINR